MNQRLRIPVCIVLCTAFIAMAVISCKNSATTVALPEPLTFAPPVVQPLKLSAPKKINFDSIKGMPIHPEVRPFDMDKLPVRSYDTGAYKAVRYQPETAKFDLNALPSKDLDIDKLPSKPLHFKTYKLSPPKLIKAGGRRLINDKMLVYEIGAAQGLKADTIRLTFTDHDGFVWISTDKGLYRYDGENFWLFDNLPYKNDMDCILQDAQGQIWTANFNSGIQAIDIQKGIVKTMDAKSGLSTDSVNSMVIDKRQRIWLTTWGEGVNIIDPQTQTIKQLSKKEGLSSEICPYIAQDAEHNIWLSSTWDGGLNYIDLKNKKISYINTKNGLPANNISAILCDHAGRVWVSAYTNKDIIVIDPGNGTIQTINESSNVINITHGLFEDKQGRVWAGKNNNGLEIIDPEKHTRIYLSNNTDLSSKEISAFSQDKQGQIWVAGTTKLNVIETNRMVLDQVGNQSTTALFEDSRGLVWRAGDFDGVSIIDRQKKTIRTLNSANGLKNDTMMFIEEHGGKMLFADVESLYFIDSGRRSMSIIGKNNGSGPANTVRSSTVDSYGNIWLARRDGIDVYYPGSKTVKHLGEAEGLGNASIEDMCTDNAGHIWISTLYKGIGIIDPVAGTIRYIAFAPLNDAEQRFLLPGKDGNIWISTKSGLLDVNLAKNTLTLLTSREGLIAKGITSVLENNNRIYAGTVKGITIVSPPGSAGSNKNWQFESFGSFWGLDKKNNDEQSDLVTRDGQYWMGDMGITVFNLPAQDTTNYPVYIAGLNIVDKPRFFSGDAPEKADGMAWDKVEGAANMPANLHIAHDQNFMQFHYGTLDPARHDTVWYKYRLLGADKDWSETTSATSTPNYINLGPGNYTFEVTSLRYDRTWNKPAILSFTINPPWWQTWWAYVLYAVLLTGSIWGFSHYRSRQLIKDKRVLEHKVHLRTEEVIQQKEEIEAQRDDLEKAFKDLKTTQTQLVQSEKMASLGELTAGIAHEIQNPLNFVNNFSDVNREMLAELREELGKGNIDEAMAIANDLDLNEEKINHHGKRADFIVKGMLQHSRTSTGEKQLTNINTLADEFFKLSYHGLRAKDKTFNAELVTHFDPELPKANVVQQDIGRVLLNLFNNAFYAVNQKQKTTGADFKAEVSVTTSSENGQVVIKVKDNGIGIPDAIKEKIMQPFFTTKPTGQGTGLGLSLTYDMVVKGHGGNIQVNSVDGEGSEFIISLPLGLS